MKQIKKAEQKSNHMYGMIGMVALFLVGAIFGFILNGSDRMNRSIMTEKQCQELTDKMGWAIRDGRYEDIEKLNAIYSENCLNRDFQQPKKHEEKVAEQKLPETTCEVIEELLKQNLNREDSMDWNDHYANVRVYKRLAEKGCDKNQEKYLNLAQRENDIAKALDNYGEMEYDDNADADETTCEQIETLLTRRLHKADEQDTYAHIDNAKIYANLSERGCPENSLKYRELAKQELEIARALNDDNLERERESVEIVETYKRLQMQAEAARMIEKAKKLTNPAIDFIIQLEKIIEE